MILFPLLGFFNRPPAIYLSLNLSVKLVDGNRQSKEIELRLHEWQIVYNVGAPITSISRYSVNAQ